MRRLALLALLAAAALAACGDDERAAAPVPADPTQLEVEVTEARPEPIRMTLTCGGTCDVDRLEKAIALADDESRICTTQYGGPETAHVTGTVEGRDVDVTLTRSDGCGISSYAAVFEAFGERPPLAR